MTYIDDCDIGGAGVIHLSKAKWRKLDKIQLGEGIFI
jgi:hypothetical protein